MSAGANADATAGTVAQEFRADWVALARELGPAFAARAAEFDETDTFVAENYAELNGAPGLLRRGASGAGWRRCLTPRAVRHAARAGPALRLDRARAVHAHPPARRDRVALAPATTSGAAAATHRRRTDRLGQHRGLGLARFLRHGRPGGGRLPHHRTQDLRQWLSRRHAAGHQRGRTTVPRTGRPCCTSQCPSPPKA